MQRTPLLEALRTLAESTPRRHVGEGTLRRLKREAEHAAVRLDVPDVQSRQQLRRIVRKVDKRAAAQKVREETAATLAAVREAVAPQRKRAAKRAALTAASRRKPNPHGDLKFLHRAARAGVLLSRTIAEQEKSKRVRTKKAVAA